MGKVSSGASGHINSSLKAKNLAWLVSWLAVMLNAKTRAFPLISGHNYQKVALEQSDVAALGVMEIKGMKVWVNLALQELSSNSLISIIPSALYQHFDCARLARIAAK